MLITVVIPTFNMAHSLPKALESLERQTYQNFEVIIVNDGSTDKTNIVVKKYLNRNSNWKYFEKNNGHWGSVINYVIKHNLIQGEYVTILDADDWFIESAFEKIANKLNDFPEIDFIVADSYNWFNKTKTKRRIYNAPFKSRFIDKYQAINPWIRQLGKFYKAQIFKTIPSLEENVDFNDVIIHAFLISRSKIFYYLSTPIAYYWSDHKLSLTRWQDNPQQKNWVELFNSYEIADQWDETNREIAGIFLMNLWFFRKKIKEHLKTHKLPQIHIKTKGIKFKWLPWYTRILPLKTYFKAKTHHWWTERETVKQPKNKPYFTVIVPAFNVEKVIDNSLKSLEKQTYQQFEVIIVDDGSIDNTENVIKPFLKRNQQWKYYKKSNGNWGSVINYVLKHNLIQGEYVTILDADDWFLPHALISAANVLSEDKLIDVLISKVILFSGIKKYVFPVVLSFKSKYLSTASARTPLSTPHGKFYKSQLFKTLNPLRENRSYQDTVLYNNLITNSQRIYFYNKPLSTWWVSRPENSTQIVWDEKRINFWLETIELICQQNPKNEITSYALMYLWELSRNVKKYSGRKLQINPKLAKFKWVPWYLRNTLPIKSYFKWKTRKFWERENITPIN